jgi:brefeldin A-inhibited guanine nucleotide-exchange protein
VSEAGATSSDVAGKIVDAFVMKRNAEQNFEIGAVKFTLSLKSGLVFFIENGFVQCDTRELALFFLANKDKLDKTQMGEALGREPDAAFVKEKDVEADKGGPGFWVRILHHYVDALDFTGMVFDEAIRLFLAGFRLPGEAQKIDRIMEKFAEKFTSQNPVSG